MSVRRLHAVHLMGPVPFDTPTDRRLLAKHGKLEWHVEDEYVLATSPKSNRRPIVIPMDAVLYLEPMSEAEQLELEKRERGEVADESEPEAEEPEAPAAPPADDTVKFVKDKDGTIREVKASEAEALLGE